MNSAMCAFASLADFDFATTCCTDALFKDLGESRRALCPNVITDAFEPCEFYSASTCCPGGGGIVLPFSFLYQQELDMPIAPRGIAYFTLLIWLFMGVMIISDSFMGAIDEITS